MARLHPSPFAASGGFFRFPTHEKSSNKRKEQGMAFKLTVKNGDTRYERNQETGKYDSKKQDKVVTYDSLGEALADFLYNIDEDLDGYHLKPVTLTFTPKKKKKGNKN